MVAAALNFVNGDYNSGGNDEDSTTTASVTTSVSGSCFVVCIAQQDDVEPTVTDSEGNTYSEVTGASVDDVLTTFDTNLRIYLCVDGDGGAGHTFTSSATAAYATVIAFEVTGADLADAEQQANGQLDSASPFVDGGITTDEDDVLLIACMMSDASDSVTPAVGNSFTVQEDEVSGGSLWPLAVATRNVTSTGTYEGSWTANGGNATEMLCNILALKSAIVGGAGMVLASADFLQGTAAAEDPAAFNFEKALPWGAITIALRPSSSDSLLFTEGDKFNRLVLPTITWQDGAYISDVVVEGDAFDVDGEDMDNVLITGDLEIQTAGVYNYSDVIVMGDVTNSDGTGNAQILLSGNSSMSTSTPGTGNGQVDIVNAVTVSVLVRDTSGSVIVGATVRVVATETVGTITDGDVIMTGTTNGSGVVEITTFNYESAFDPSGLDIAIRVRKSSAAPLYKSNNSTGNISNTGSNNNVTMLDD